MGYIRTSMKFQSVSTILATSVMTSVKLKLMIAICSLVFGCASVGEYLKYKYSYTSVICLCLPSNSHVVVVIAALSVVS